MKLPPSQIRALQFIADGHPSKLAPDILGIATPTLKAQLLMAYRTLGIRPGIRTDAHAVAIAMRAGIIK
jgi:DNA-binding CsgD family transcriptional regulator